MSQLFQVIVLAVGATCTACVAAGDGLLVLKGRVPSTGKNAVCQLALLRTDESVARPYNVRNISQDYREDFTVEPKGREYLVRISCPGYKVHEQSVRYEPPATDLDLGPVTLSPTTSAPK
jgi:hypothetical protein